jgi:hypothetical protein
MAMQAKLTLRLDAKLIRRAKSHAKKTGRSVSQMVAHYFTLLGDESSREEELTPVVHSLRGSLRGARVDEREYRRYLEDKYLKG